MSFPIDWADPKVRAYLRELGKKGGRSRSAAEKEAARTNQKKAVEARRLKRSQILATDHKVTTGPNGGPFGGSEL